MTGDKDTIFSDGNGKSVLPPYREGKMPTIESCPTWIEVWKYWSPIIENTLALIGLLVGAFWVKHSLDRGRWNQWKVETEIGQWAGMVCFSCGANILTEDNHLEIVTLKLCPMCSRWFFPRRHWLLCSLRKLEAWWVRVV